MSAKDKLFPIYRSDGEWVAVYYCKHLFTIDKMWIGFAVGRDVYDTTGQYLGFLSEDRRLLRQRSVAETPLKQKPPAKPICPQLPSRVPLSSLFKSLPFSMIDMFEAYPERLVYMQPHHQDIDE